MTTIEEFNNWLQKPEGCDLEFKEAKNMFNANKDLPDYCAALANEGGGKLILGVDNNRKVVGTTAFQGTYNKLTHDLLTKIKIRVDVEQLDHTNGRILIFHIPPHLQGIPIKSTGAYTYPMRAGESLTEMDETTLKSIFNETTTDFSRQIAKGLSLADLDEDAINNFRKRWSQKARRDDYLTFPDEKMLRATGLLTDKGINYACLILFGKNEKIDELIPCSEIVFEWRQDARKISHDFRINWREPFFKFYDKIWDAINARNLRIPFQEGLFQREIYAFSEKPVREALLNAVAHRDYTINSQSIFIKASPEEFIIESPGGFPPGITLENILHKTSWRNRMIAETFEKAGLAERSGQGVDDIFESTIKEGKGMPDLTESDTHLVRLRIPAQVKDKNFIFFLEKVARSKQLILSFEQIYELEKIREQQRVPKLKYTSKFLELGIIESIGRTRGTKYILSHKYYAQEGKVGTHTRLTGLSRNQIKELILNHLRKNRKGVMKDFLDAFRDLKQQDLNNLLQELKRAGKVIHEGARRSGYWVLREGN